MEIARAPFAFSGFVVRKPIADFPALSHCGEVGQIPATDFHWHSVPCFEFFCTVRGVQSLEVAGQTYRVNAGEMTVIYPGEVHSHNSRTTAKTQSLWLGLDLAAIGQDGKKLAKTIMRRRVRLLRQAHEVELAIRALYRQLIRHEPGFEHVARLQVGVIVALLAQHIQAGDSRDASAPIKRRRPRNAPLANSPYTIEIALAISFLQQNLGRRVKVNEIANLVGWSPIYFHERFRAEVGIPPHAMHLHMRLDAAREALANPTSSITNVAQSFGFSSSQHFSAVFATQFGISPSQWRRRQASNNAPRAGGSHN